MIGGKVYLVGAGPGDKRNCLKEIKPCKSRRSFLRDFY